MSKYLLVTLVLLIAVTVWRHKHSKTVARRPRPASPRPAAAMVRCAHCGVHLPQTDALPAGQQHYCSPAHRQLGPRPGSQSV